MCMIPDAEQEDEFPFAPWLTYRRMLESIREYAIFVMDPEGNIATWNQGVREVFGFEKEEFLGKPGAMLFTPEDREERAPEMEMETARRDGSAGDNRWHLRKDGSRFWANGVLLCLQPDESRGEGDGQFAYLKILRDNTLQKQAETALLGAHSDLERRVEERTAELQATVEELRRSENLFAAVFRAGPFAAIIIDADGTVLEVNAAFEGKTGYTADEIVGENLPKFSPESPFAASVDEGFADGSGGFRNRELELRTRQGELRHVIASGVELEVNGHMGRLVMFFDITERKRTEAELMQAITDVMTDASWFTQSIVERLGEVRAGRGDVSRADNLTRRERQVLEQVARGHSNAQIAADLGIAPQTVRNYITSVYEKIGVRTRVEAVVWARERGLGL